MSYFDSRVHQCPFWQVVLIRVAEKCVKVDIKADTADTKMSQFSAEG